ncbi:unnamed protein product [Absidia cylindrospora]
MVQLTNLSKRPLVFFNIVVPPLNHPLTIPTLIATVSASALLYYYIKLSQAAHLAETTRKMNIKKRKQLLRPEDRFASLKVNTRFVNPFEEWHDVPFLETALFWLRRWKGNGLPKSQLELEQSLPVQTPALKTIFAKHTNKNRMDYKLIDHDRNWLDNNTSSLTPTNVHQAAKDGPVTFTWFGQSTCLITIEGLAILTDPVFSRCSINDYLGPKRLRPIPCPLEKFEKDLDIVLVSHDHFDHLDEKVVYQLGNSVTWYVPLGLRHWFLKRKVTNVVELDWWQEIQHHSRPDIIIACVPAMHWSGSRTPFEKNGTLWCSYVVKGQDDAIFFCGDTGYLPDLFKAIGDLYAPFTLAAIPIGSFKPEPMMQHVHMGPEDAIRVHEDLKMPRLSVGIHWGTFMMSDEHYLEPPRALAELWQKRQHLLDQDHSNSLSMESVPSSTCSTTSTTSSTTSSPFSPKQQHSENTTPLPGHASSSSTTHDDTPSTTLLTSSMTLTHEDEKQRYPLLTQANLLPWHLEKR